MATPRSSIFLETIEHLAKSPFLSEGDHHGLAEEIVRRAAEHLKIERTNIWLMNDKEDRMECVLAYALKNDRSYRESDLLKDQFPCYFEHISKNDIIISNDAQAEPFNKELLHSYLIPVGIRSMMEVPIISGGKLKGIICFEHLNTPRQWTNDEQHFAVALTQLYTLTLETAEKNHYRKELEKLVKEKTVLISEINHRVKNNLAIINALIRGESNKVLDLYHKNLFDTILSKTYSLAALQDAMYKTQNYKEVNFAAFLTEMISDFHKSFAYEIQVEFYYEKPDELMVDVNKVIPLALIVNEILTNTYKYAFKKDHNNKLITSLKSQEEECILSIKDNGSGLPDEYLRKGTGLGLIRDLAEQIDGRIEIVHSSEGTEICVLF
jgi:two-component sensor histidine kinase